ncbi:MAG: HAD-IA family hydrolase, partial [Myxococcota bacterium]
MTRVLLLDVMSTLVSEPFYEDIPDFLGISLEELRKRRNHDAYLSFEKGLIEEEAYAEQFFIDGPRLDIEGMKATLRRSAKLLPGVERCLERVQQSGIPMYGLSNYSTWYTEIDAATGLSRFLDWRFTSCLTGVRKPDPEAYLGPARALDLPVTDCLFVDDRPVNVEAAEAVGMPALLRTPELDLEAAFE